MTPSFDESMRIRAFIRQEQKSEEPAIQQLTEECEDLKSEINQLNKKQAVLRHETTELKNYLRELNDQMVSSCCSSYF